MRICEVEDCSRKHVAKGMCATHYNRANYTNEQRHPKRVMACASCGALVEKHWGGKSRRPVCSYRCRYVLQFGKEPPPPKSKALVGPVAMESTLVPADPGPDRTRFVASECRWCGKPYLHDLRVTGAPSHWCSKRCGRKASKVVRRAREVGATGTYTLAELIHVYLAHGRECAYCGKVGGELPDPDHVVPLSRGGSNSITNIVPACRRCNGDKRDLLLDEWRRDRESKGKPRLIFDLSRYAHLTSVS